MNVVQEEIKEATAIATTAEATTTTTTRNESPAASSFSLRLRQLKQTVNKATAEALQQSKVAGIQRLSNYENNDQQNNNNDDVDDNASFHLGMELFGPEPAEVERRLQDDLKRLETQVQALLQAKQQQQENRHYNNNNNNNENNNNNKNTAQHQQQLEQQHDVLKLQFKIRFLQLCSQTRAGLDESRTLLVAPPLPQVHDPDNDPLVQSMHRWLEAHEAIQQARDMIVQQQQQQQQSSSSSLMAALDMVTHLEAQCLRHKVDIVAQAKILWQASIELAPQTLSVRVQTAPLNSAYAVLERLWLEQTHHESSHQYQQRRGSTALLDVLRKFVQTLHEQCFQPELDQWLLSANEATTTTKRTRKWQFQETTDRSSSSNNSHSLPSTTTSSVALPSGPIRRLEWSLDEQAFDVTEPIQTAANQDPSDRLAPWKDTFEFMQRILCFTAEHVLLKRDTLCAMVGRRLFGKPQAIPSALNLELFGIESRRLGDDHGILMEPLLACLQATCIPDRLESSQLQDQLQASAETLREIIDPFLASMTTCGFLTAESDPRLANFVSTLEQQYVENRRRLILNQARHLLIKNDYHNTVTVGVDVPYGKDERLGITDGMAVFQLHKCSISDTAYQLMKLCRDTMDESVAQPVIPDKDSPLAVLPAALYRSAREGLDLFRSIIPVTHGYEIKNLPRTAAILHNDCVYLAHHCLTLGLEYKDRFPEVTPDDARGTLLRQTCFFVDMVPLFRDLADRALGDMLDLQANQIVEIVEPRIPIFGEALRSDDIVVEWSDAEAALAAATYHLRHVYQAWEPILSRDILSRSMWFLADVIFTLFLDQVTKAKDISMNAGQFVRTLFQKATHDIQTLLGGEDADTSKSRTWDRFTVIGRLMDMSLADVLVALSDGMFRSVSGPELCHLITATFQPSPKRQQVLDLLASH